MEASAMFTLFLYAHSPEVLHGDLYPEADNNGLKKKKHQPPNTNSNNLHPTPTWIRMMPAFAGNA
jgi:hypothetical protein